MCYDPPMRVTVHPGPPSGSVTVPTSKSHTIRALLIASAATGVSTIQAPLDSGDAASCITVCRALGASVTETRDDDGTLASVRVEGTGGKLHQPEQPLDCGNSGTTLYLGTGLAAVCDGPVTFTGDDQLRRRPVEPLLAALAHLGVTYQWREHRGTAPFTVTGPVTGGRTSISSTTSQYLSSLLLASPLATRRTEIDVPLLNERPYVEMTLGWLDRQSIRYQHDDFRRFEIEPDQQYTAFTARIPGDFSSATFLLVAAAITGATLDLHGLDPSDNQGDRNVLSVLDRLGCSVTTVDAGVRIQGPPDGALSGGEIDLNAMPDALPALAVAGAGCTEPLQLINVPQAREKETDRIAVMAGELAKLGVAIRERPDGLVVSPSRISGGRVSSHGDHRVAMALAVAGMIASGPVTIDGAQAAAITYPRFYDDLRTIGIDVRTEGSS